MFMKLYDYISKGLDGFANDPADDDYQRGYEACLIEVREEMLRILAENT